MQFEIRLGDNGNGTRKEQKATPAPDAAKQRAEQLALARTAYNYMRTYPNLDQVPLCAGVPDAENFSIDYDALVMRSNVQIAQNYLAVVDELLQKEFTKDERWWRLNRLFQDVESAMAGLGKLASDALAKGPTALLQSTLDDVLNGEEGGMSRFSQSQLDPSDIRAYGRLLKTLARPQMLDIVHEDWMPPEPTVDQNGALHGLHQCERDWFFSWMQVAGYNTTNLRGVVDDANTSATLAIKWSDLQAKLPIDDQIYRKETGRTDTLADALREGRLYALDYTFLIGDGDLSGKNSEFNGRERYLPSPVALFYWNDAPPSGFPPSGFSGKSTGVLQPIAIKLGTGARDAIFTPRDAADSNDKHGVKWRIAKYFVNVAAAIQHESVAHLGNCHFILEAIIIAAHRQLSVEHPIYKLLEPHFKFTLRINGGALQSLIAPGGVVATNVGPDIHWTLELVNQARQSYEWKQNRPDTLFQLRGVDSEKLVFPFRQDTMDLWSAIVGYVTRYVDVYYGKQGALAGDAELHAFFSELRDPSLGNVRGLDVPRTKAELVQFLAQVIYTAGPLHASVNYAQYPLGAYIPAVAATIYRKAPTKKDDLSMHDYLEWLPPLDVALYTISFEYLLSSIQYDTFGHYSGNPHFKWFPDNPALQAALDQFQSDLAQAEVDIRKRNLERPVPYTFQLPSRIPNSISI